MGSFLEISLELGFMLIVLSVVIAFVRLVKGPSLQDRVVALDMMTVSIVAFCGLAAIRYETSAFIDVALVLALVGFLATVALARFAERNTARAKEGGPQ
ncbi:monovalent cation/H+ antiporter complex subunit F [Marivita sp. S0852]|uniref:monovalent cation/H+ antiporter complex subunit F n=1 Tax=Marivita sp. S0852 TaxID=3373893 RepID=UPI0039819FFA